MGKRKTSLSCDEQIATPRNYQSSVVCAEWTEVLTVRFFANQPWLVRDLGRMRPGENQVRLHKIP